jgi:CO dehydrogenase nickel-insertion accessory protein CooC1
MAVVVLFSGCLCISSRLLRKLLYRVYGMYDVGVLMSLEGVWFEKVGMKAFM